MQTEDATNPGAEEDVRVLDQQGVDQTDNSITVDGDQDDNEADEASDPDEGEQTDEAGGGVEDDDSEEIEWEDGQKYRVPKALKDGFLRQADYTRKTQEVAEEKRKAAERITQWEAQSEELSQAQALRLTIDNRLKEIDSLTDAQWEKLYANDPAKANALEREARRLRDQAGQVEQAVQDYTSKLTAEQETERSNLRATMFSEVQKKVPNWTDQLGDEVAAFAIQEFGISPEALKNLTDAPSLLVLHRAYEGSKALKAQRETLKHAKRQQTAPASTVRGTSGRFAVKPDTDDFAAFEKLADEKLAGAKR
jgi:hypothetical protein